MFEKHIDVILYNYHKHINLNMSLQFLICSYTQLEAEFYKTTGIKMNNRANINPPVRKEYFFLDSGPLSRMPVCVYINHNWLTFNVCWQSASGKIYKPEDEQVDCNDVQFRFENLDVSLVHECMYPGGGLPFKTDKLGYDLEIQGLDMDMHIRLHFLPEKAEAVNASITEIDKFINAYNEKSEKKNREDGVVHNWKRSMEGNTLVFEIDTGSAGMKFLSGLLKRFSKLGLFSRVVIGGD